MKPRAFPSEICYLVSIVLLSFAVAMVAAAGFGVSMVVAPAYVLSLKVPFLTFGQSEYVVQLLLFAVFSIAFGMALYRPARKLNETIAASKAKSEIML